MTTSSLKEFAELVPLCEQTSGLATVLEIFRSSGCDTIVVVSEQQRPLGVITLRQILPYLIALARVEQTSVASSARDLHQPVSELEPPIIEPLIILPAQQSLSQFWVYFQSLNVETLENPANLTTRQWGNSQPYWALVDENETFLGLLNSWRLLKFVAAKFLAADTANSDEQPQPAGLTPLVQLLEQLPLPLSLQTATGHVLVENLTWRQQIGTFHSWDGDRRTNPQEFDSPLVETPLGQLAATSEKLAIATLGVSVERRSAICTSTTSKSPAVATLDSSATTQPLTFYSTSVPDKPANPLAHPAAQVLTRSLAVGNSSREPCKPSSRTAIQRCCAISIPKTATTTTGSPGPVSLPTLPAIHIQDASMAREEPELGSDLQKQNQNRLFSFVKIPLPASLVWQESGTDQEWENRLAHPAIPELWLVVAQDTTDQQQVAKELADKNADLVQLNRLKDEFLACISHELKTPLTAILGLSSLLKDQTLGKLNDRQARYARLIYQSGRQLMTVINDILDLTRMETGQLELTQEPVQIQSVCDRAYAQALQRPSEKDQQEDESTLDIPFTLEIEPGLDLLIADELRLRQMLVHLLSNALKFTDASGEIGLRVNRWEGWIAFTVWDTGIGIPEEKQHLIFQKFQQLENPLNRRFEGAGLGLVLTQRLAHLHGGDVSFISKIGQGSQFTLVLPPCPPERRTSTLKTEVSQNPIEHSLRQPATQSSLNRLVLIVETVPRYLEDLTEQLKHLGYHAVIARSGTEAIEKARSLQPHAILLNPLLPQLSGWDVLTLLKSDAQTLHIPVLVTATQAEKQQAYLNKADGFLNLPVQEHALLQSLTASDKPPSKPRENLTILYLSPELAKMPADSCALSSELTNLLSLQLSELNYRVLEADDLDQAELLAHVWKPDVVLLNTSEIADPFDYLQQFSLHSGLTALPLIALDRQTVEAANQIDGLAVYPCLVANNQQKMASLRQVIQVAVGISCQPNILVVDIGEPGNGVQVDKFKIEDPNQSSSLQAVTLSQAANLQPYAPWLQALVQYLQTAGFRSLLSCSWIEVQHQLRSRSVDLLLIRLTDISDTSTLANGLIALAKLPNRPPVLVLDHRLNSPSPDHAIANQVNSASELDFLLKAITAKILHGSSQSMSQLLDWINQILERKH